MVPQGKQGAVSDLLVVTVFLTFCFRNIDPVRAAVVKENDEHIAKIVETLERDGLEAHAGFNDDIIDKDIINLKFVICQN